MLTVFRKMLSLVLVLSVLQVNAIEISSYARVSKKGSTSIEDNNDKLENNGQTNSSSIRQTVSDAEVKAMSANTQEEGRAMQNSYKLPTLSQLLRRPVQSNSNKNTKSGRFIVYPSYPQFNGNSVNVPQYNMMPSNVKQTAQRRFQYTPDQIYPFKGGDSNPGYKYSAPPDQPPKKPPATFTAPIYVPPSQPKPAYLPPDAMQPPGPPGSHFLPTVRPEESDLHAFPSHINSSFLPPELDSIKNSIDSFDSGEDTTDTPSENLYNFPPNIDSAYLPPQKKVKTPANSYLPNPSGDDSKESDESVTIGTSPYEAPEDLNNFPPNIGSAYPKNMLSGALGNSYLSPPSGDQDAEIPLEEGDETATYIPPKSLFNFPPNIDSAYLPPQNKIKSPVNSYLPSPSGDDSKENEESDDIDPVNYEAPEDLNNFPPNIGSAYPQKLPNQALGNSYLSPPSGDKDAEEPVETYLPPKNLYNFPPNINSNYLPPQTSDTYLPPPAIDDSGSPQSEKSQAAQPLPMPYSYMPPQNPFNFPPNIQSSYLPPEMRQVKQSVSSYLPPASGSVSGFYEGSKPTIPDAPPMAPPADMMDMAPPTGMMDMAPPPDYGHHDHSPPDYHDHHDHDHPPWYDYSDHHHHHHHEDPPTTTTTTEAPEEPRVKKYSYYYLGRKLWYIPLYFTLWFCLYVAALIIRSIGRHKVDLPNHYVSRSLNDMSNEEVIRKINKMTAFTMQQIEEFKEKYL